MEMLSQPELAKLDKPEMPGTACADWYVVHTKPRLELRARANLDQQRYETWLPMLSLWRRQAGRWIRYATPMFPRYLFLRTYDQRQSLAPVRSTPGVAALVRMGVEPARISDRIVEELRQVEAATELAGNGDPTPFRRGEAVSVVGGPLVGLAGIVTRTEGERVAVLISLLGRGQEILLDFHQLAS